MNCMNDEWKKRKKVTILMLGRSDLDEENHIHEQMCLISNFRIDLERNGASLQNNFTSDS